MAERRAVPDPTGRVVVENLQPAVDGGRFPVKRTTGDLVTVTADVFADGHDVIVAILRDRHRPVGTRDTAGPNAQASLEDASTAQWRETPMSPVAPGTDQWAARFEVDEPGWHEFSIVAWVDPFLSWQHDLDVKARAGQDVSLELLEGAHLIEAIAGHPEAESLGSRPRRSKAARPAN